MLESLYISGRNPIRFSFQGSNPKKHDRPRRLTTEQIVQSMQNLSENESDNEELGGFILDNSTDEDFHPRFLQKMTVI